MTSASSSQWDTELAGAFEILLGRPLNSFDPAATYAVYHEDDLLSCDFMESGGIFSDYSKLGSVIPPDSSSAREYPLHWNRWSLDLGKSYFAVDDIDLDPAVEAELRAASHGGDVFHVVGADLADILSRHEISFDMPPGVHVRAVTDGTLFDAMRVATWTMDPDELLEFGSMDDDYEVEVDDAWAAALGRIANPALRDHLRMLCLDAQSARAQGAFHSGPDQGVFSGIAELPGKSYVTGWQFGEGQAATGIIQHTA